MLNIQKVLEGGRHKKVPYITDSVAVIIYARIVTRFLKGLQSTPLGIINFGLERANKNS